MCREWNGLQRFLFWFFPCYELVRRYVNHRYFNQCSPISLSFHNIFCLNRHVPLLMLLLLLFSFFRSLLILLLIFVFFFGEHRLFGNIEVSNSTHFISTIFLPCSHTLAIFFLLSRSLSFSYSKKVICQPLPAYKITSYISYYVFSFVPISLYCICVFVAIWRMVRWLCERHLSEDGYIYGNDLKWKLSIYLLCLEFFASMGSSVILWNSNDPSERDEGLSKQKNCKKNDRKNFIERSEIVTNIRCRHSTAIQY